MIYSMIDRMFGLTNFRKIRSTAAPALRARLGCEQLADRINPTTIGSFTASGVAGSFNYDETQVNPTLSSQTIVLNDFQFTANGIPFAAESAPVANLAYGQFVSIDDFDASCTAPGGGPELTVSVDGSTATILNHFTSNTTTVNNVTVDIKPQGSVAIDFGNYKDKTTGQPVNADTITITVKTKDKDYVINIDIGANTTGAGVAAGVGAALEDNGFTNVTVTGSTVTLKGPAPNSEAFTGFTLTHTNSDNRDPGFTKYSSP